MERIFEIRGSEDLKNIIYRVVEYKYLGGSYGKCNENLMLEELQKNGPFVVSFETDLNFIYYKSGIYHSLDSRENNNIFPNQKTEWRKIDHSVLLVGFGEDEKTKEKFWILQNTWGPNWGEEGFFRIRRGNNEMGIESTCEIAVPVIIDNKNNHILLPKDEGFLPNSKVSYLEEILRKNVLQTNPPFIPKSKGFSKSEEIFIGEIVEEIRKEIISLSLRSLYQINFIY